MLGILFLLIFIAATSAFFYLQIRNNDNGAKNGAFLLKYKKLISLLTEKRRSDIEKVKTDSLSLRISLHKDSHFFSITEVDERLIVVWKLHSRVFGKRGKEWSFSLDYDQVKMYSEILTDIRNYQDNLRRENPHSDQVFLTLKSI